MEEAEVEHDLALLQDESDEGKTREVALIAYFHRMTGVILQTMAQAIARVEGSADQAYHDNDDTEDDASPIDPDSIEDHAPIEEEEN